MNRISNIKKVLDSIYFPPCPVCILLCSDIEWVLLRRVTAGKLSCVSAVRGQLWVPSSGLTIVHYTHSVTRPGPSISSQHQRSPDSSRSCSSPRPGRSSPPSQGSWTGRAVFTCTRSSRTFGAPQPAQWAGPGNRRAGRAACYTGAAFMCSNLRLMLWPHTPQLLLALFSNSNMCIAE